jgi:hypothetical protein
LVACHNVSACLRPSLELRIVEEVRDGPRRPGGLADDEKRGCRIGWSDAADD